MTDIERGLTSEEAKKLTEEGLSNVAVENQSKSVGQIVAGNIFTYFNFIFLVLALLLALVGSYINMTFVPVIVCNTLIGIIQEIRSKRVLDKLTLLNASKTMVIRNGAVHEAATHTLVKGDVCIFGAGDQICADAVLRQGTVRVNEALITGEADEVTKSIGDQLFSGSFVVSGSCKSQLQQVGLNSFASKLALEAKASRKKQQTEMMKSLDKLVKVIGILIIPIGIIMFCQERFLLGVTTRDSVVAVVAALVGMIPEGLYLLASVALVVSVMRLGQKNVLVHEMACVETLARVNVLCVDKTGTITENKMSVQEILPLQPYNEFDYPPLHGMIGDFVNNLNADNTTMKTLKEYFDSDSYKRALRIFSFSSETKYCGVVFEDGAYVLGAPEMVLREDYALYEDEISAMANMGCRVLVFGSYEGKLDGKPLVGPTIPLALVVLNNPIREEAKATFEYFKKQGVDIKVISGDNAVTASRVAAKAGIAHAENYVDASTLTTDALLESSALSYTVFGRVQPEQKRKLVQALKRAGRVVAMTGDGVNDVLALKSADCSIAMASGSEAASNAAQIVLLDSDFSCMPSVVLEGRRVVNNIQRAASLFLVKNIFSMMMALFALVTANKYPLYPTQLSLLGAFTIGIPAFFLALQPNKSIINGHFLTNVSIKALPSALTDFVVVAFISAYGDYRNIAHDQLSTMAILVLLTVGMATLVRICRPFDWIRTVVCTGMLASIVFSIIFLKRLFAIYTLTFEQAVSTAILMAISIPIFLFMCWLVNYITVKVGAHNKYLF